MSSFHEPLSAIRAKMEQRYEKNARHCNLLDPISLLNINTTRYLKKDPKFQPSKNEIRIQIISRVALFIFRTILTVSLLVAISSFTPISAVWVSSAGILAGALMGLKQGFHGNKRTIDELICLRAEIDSYHTLKGKVLIATIIIARHLLPASILYALSAYTPLSPLVATVYPFFGSYALANEMTCLAARKIKLYLSHESIDASL